MKLCTNPKCKKLFEPLMPDNFYREIYRDREREKEKDEALKKLYHFDDEELEAYKTLNGRSEFIGVWFGQGPVPIDGEVLCHDCRIINPKELYGKRNKKG